MTLLRDLLASLSDDAPVRSVLVSRSWTVVCSRRCGMSARLSNPHAGAQIPDLDRLRGISARRLAEWGYSTDLLEASIGVAAINSLLDVDGLPGVEVNASEVVARLGRGKNIALVGRFHFIPRVRRVARRLWVIEQQPAEGEYAPESAVDLLPRADVVAITGSALVNHTLEGLLALCPPGTTVIVVGPSAPFSQVLFDHGVTVISGTCVADENAFLRTVAQSTSLSQVGGIRLMSCRQGKEACRDETTLEP